MNFKNIIKKVGFTLKKHAPEICTALGISCTIGGTVLACRATLKMTDIWDDANEKREFGKNVIEGKITIPQDKVYTSEDYEEDLKIIKRNAIVDTVKCYILPAFVITAGICLNLYSNHIYKDRASQAILYAEGLKAMLEKKNKTTESTVTEDEDGNIKTEYGSDDTDWSFFFDENCSQYVKSNIMNASKLQYVSAKMFDICQERKHVMLNDLWTLLGYEPTPKQIKLGHTFGWLPGDIIDLGCEEFFDDVLSHELDNVSACGVWLRPNCRPIFC